LLGASCPAVRVRTCMATMSGAVAVAHACGVECCRGHQEPAHSSAAHAVRLHAEPVMSSTQPRMPSLPAVYSAPRLTWKRQAADVILPCGCVFAPQMQTAAGASTWRRSAVHMRGGPSQGACLSLVLGRASPLPPTPGTHCYGCSATLYCPDRPLVTPSTHVDSGPVQCAGAGSLLAWACGARNHRGRPRL